MHHPNPSSSEQVSASPNYFAADFAVPAAGSRPSPFAPWHEELLDAIRQVRRATGSLLIAAQIAKKSGRPDLHAVLMDRWSKLHDAGRTLEPLYADALEDEADPVTTLPEGKETR